MSPRPGEAGRSPRRVVGRSPGRSLAGARVLVTGASSGIGRAVVDTLVARGARVVASGRSDAGLASAVAAGAVASVAADLQHPGAAQRVVADAASALGGLDGVVACAGAGWAGPFATMSPPDLAAVVGLDLTATAEVLLAAVPLLTDGDPDVARGVVVVGSIAGLLPVAGEAAYSAAKAGVTALAEALRAEVRAAGVTVSVVAPGIVDTPFFDRRNAGLDRSWPRPIPARKVAEAVARCLETGRPLTVLPGWLRVPVWLRGAAPGMYRALADRLA